MSNQGDTMTSELRPCPFCGSVPETPGCYRTDQGTKWGRIVCGNCEAHGPEVRTGYGDPEAMDGWGKDAIAEWNRRAPCAEPPAPASPDVERAAVICGEFAVSSSIHDNITKLAALLAQVRAEATKAERERCERAIGLAPRIRDDAKARAIAAVREKQG